MLPRTAYFKALATLGSDQTSEWHALVAGLVTLRLVDNWLDFGPYDQERHQEEFRNVRSLIANVPRTHSLQPLLDQIVLAIEQAECVSTHLVATPMLAYTESLETSAKFSLAQDVLLPLRMRAERTSDFQTAMRASSRLAYVLRIQSQWDPAIDSYHRAIHYAMKMGDTTAALKAMLGEAKLITTLGNWNRGYEIVAEISCRAKTLAIDELIGTSLHELAVFATMRHDHSKAISLYSQAMKHDADGIRGEEHRIADFASALMYVEDFSTSRDLNINLALTARDQLIRWHATMCLMSLAALEQQVENFEQYWSALELAPLNPWLMIGYRYCAAKGYRRLGNEFRAQEEYRRGQEVAEQYGIYVSFTV